MKRPQYPALLAALLFSGTAFTALAQDETDVLRYSLMTPQGTARSMGFGSALGSVGGDFTSLSVNPAGIGVYRSSEIMFTPSLKFNSVDGTYLGNLNDDNAARFNFNNFGAVFSRVERGRRYEKANWKTVSFGIGVNRVADFNRNYTYGGLMQGSGDQYSSFAEVFSNAANANPNSIDQAGSLAYLGYQSYLVNPDANNFFYPITNWETGLNQLRSVEERGGINEMVLSLGGNYMEKLMVGATLGIPIIRYTREAYFEEQDATDDLTNDFSSFNYKTSLTTRGSGFNLKAGAIYRVSDAFRLGAAVHTPSWIALNEEFNESLVVNFDDGGQERIANPENRFDYNIKTPWRTVVSATGLFGTYGFITLDYEYVWYDKMRIRYPNEYASGEQVVNNIIKTNFQGASNFRLGGEARLDNIFFRAGVGYYGNPYQSDDFDMSRMDLSLGLGYRTGGFFMDLGFVHSRFEQTEVPYVLPDPVITPAAKLENQLNNLALTFGWKF